MNQEQKNILEKARRIIKERENENNYSRICREAKICPNDGEDMKTKERALGTYGNKTGHFYIQCNKCGFKIELPFNTGVEGMG